MQRMSHGTHRILRLAAALNWSSPSAWQALIPIIGIDNLNLSIMVSCMAFHARQKLSDTKIHNRGMI